MAHQKWKVNLLLDNFSTHQAAVAQLGGDQGLSNVQILWLPKNTTSAFQPNDQGIIRTWKAHTCNHMLNWQVHQLDLHTMDPDPKLPTITLLPAIRWAVAAWSHNIKDSTTFFNCFMKSTVKVYESEPTCSGMPSQVQPSNLEQLEGLGQGSSFGPDELREVKDEVEIAMGYLQQAEVVQEMMSVSEFLNPLQEVVVDPAEDIEVQSQHSSIITIISLMVY